MGNSMNSSKIAKYFIAAEEAEKKSLYHKSEYFIFYTKYFLKGLQFFPGYILRNNRRK